MKTRRLGLCITLECTGLLDIVDRALECDYTRWSRDDGKTSNNVSPEEEEAKNECLGANERFKLKHVLYRSTNQIC